MVATSLASGDGELGVTQAGVGLVDTAPGQSCRLAVTPGTVEMGTTKLLRPGEKGDRGTIGLRPGEKLGIPLAVPRIGFGL